MYVTKLTGILKLYILVLVKGNDNILNSEKLNTILIYMITGCLKNTEILHS